MSTWKRRTRSSSSRFATMASEGHTPSKGRASSVSETASKRSAERSTWPVPMEKELPSSSRFHSQTGSPQALSLVHSCPVRVKLPDMARNYAKGQKRKPMPAHQRLSGAAQHKGQYSDAEALPDPLPHRVSRRAH